MVMPPTASAIEQPSWSDSAANGSASLCLSISISGKPTSAVLPRPAASAVAPIRAFDQRSARPMSAANAHPPRNTSHMATGMNHRCESIFTLGMRSSTSAGSAMFNTHQLRRGARSGGVLPIWRTIQPSTRQPSRSTSESSFNGFSAFRA